MTSISLSKLKRNFEANAEGENSSFIFTVCARFVSLYHFKLAYVVLQMAIKEFFKSNSKNGEIGRFNRSLLMESFLLTLRFSHSSIYSLSRGFWQSFVTIGVHKDHIPALARFCKKQLTGFFVCLLFFVKCKHYH